MSDFGIAYGDPGVGPPLNLPTFGEPPRPRIRITPDASKIATKAPAVSNVNAPLRAEDFPDYDHAEAMKAQQAYPEEKPLRAEDFPDYNHEEAMKPPPQVGQTEAALMGLRSGLTQGTYPALKGTLMSGGVGAPYLDCRRERPRRPGPSRSGNIAARPASSADTSRPQASRIPSPTVFRNLWGAFFLGSSQAVLVLRPRFRSGRAWDALR